MSLKVKFNVSGGQNYIRRKRRHRRSERKNNDFAIDVGAPEDFVVDLGNCVEHHVIHESSNSVLIRRVKEDDSVDVVVVRWGIKGGVIKDKDHISSAIASSVVSVPVYSGKQSFMNDNVYVSVGIRSYIHGTPLSELINTMKAEVLDHIKLQVSATVLSLSGKVSKKFGHLKESGLYSTTAHGYLCHLAAIERLMGNTMVTTYRPPNRIDTYTGSASLCHGNIKPEHVIVHGIEVVGIVGWSCADFIPEHIDRLSHRFMSSTVGSSNGNTIKDKRTEWMMYVADIPVSPETEEPPDSFMSQAVKYYTELYSYRVPNKYASKLGSVVNGLRLAYPEYCAQETLADGDCDTKSLSALTDQTIDTWELSTVAAAERRQLP